MKFSCSIVGEGKPEDVEGLSLPYAGANRFRFEGFVLSLQGTPSELVNLRSLAVVSLGVKRKTQTRAGDFIDMSAGGAEGFVVMMAA